MTKKNKKRPFSVGFVALGCPKNIVDSEAMLARIGQADFVLSPDPDRADVVVINTCGFIAPAKDEAMEAIHRAVRRKRKGHIKKIIVAGCLSQRMGQSLADEVPEIDAVVGLGQRDRIAEIIAASLENAQSPAPRTYLETVDPAIHDDRGRLLITPRHWAYLRISEGCDRRCAFCTIPAIRGRFRSKPMDRVVDEAKELVDFGAVELSLIAQDSNYYGRDLKLKNGLVQLLERLEALPALQWIRLMYLYPAGIDDDLIRTVAQSGKIVPYIDMPIQHINTDILKSMQRADTREHTVALVEKLRTVIPDVVLRTTVIVGYPGETDEQFDELLDFIKWARFDALGCFPFYPELDTPAAKLPRQVPDEVKNRRVDELMSLQQELIFDKMDLAVGKEWAILVDETFDGAAIGRYYGQAPHIDSVCHIVDCVDHTGRFIQGRVTGRKDYDYVVEQLDK